MGDPPAVSPQPDPPNGLWLDRWSERRILGVGLLVATIVGLTYCAIGFHYRPGGGVAVGLRDAYLHHQYAAAIAAGHPYSFIEGDPPSTGSTSHLYPAVLSLFYLAGAQGDALSVAAAGLGFACFLTSILFVWLLARRIARRALFLAVALNALSGQLAISMFDQTDATLFVPLALGSFTALVYQKRVPLAAGLVLLALTRPEGLAVSLAILVAESLRPYRWPDGSRPHVWAAALGLATSALVLVANKALAGSWMPESVLAKGLLHDYGPLGAAFLAARATFDVFSELVLGQGDGARRYYALPLIAGVCGLLGLFSRVGTRSAGHFFDRCWSCAALLAIAVAILGGVSGVHHDRYFAWILPVWSIYVAIGLHLLADRLEPLPLRAPLAALLLFFQAGSSIYMASTFASACATTGSNVRFAKQVERELPEGARLGFASASGLAYFLPRHHVTNVNGVTSPAFSHPHPNVVGAEILEHRPELRFDYWLLTTQALRAGWFQPFVGAALLAETPRVAGSDGFVLYRARWDSITDVGQPLSKGVAESIGHRRLLGSLDVGWVPSEEASSYATRIRIPGFRIEPLLATGDLEGRPVSDVGRLISGVESFRMPAERGAALTLVMRTTSGADALVRHAMHAQPVQFRVPTPLELRIRVNGHAAQTHRLPLIEDPSLIQEFAIELARETDPAGDEIEIEGDYISLGYWFYAGDRAPAGSRLRNFGT